MRPSDFENPELERLCTTDATGASWRGSYIDFHVAVPATFFAFKVPVDDRFYVIRCGAIDERPSAPNCPGTPPVYSKRIDEHNGAAVYDSQDGDFVVADFRFCEYMRSVGVSSCKEIIFAHAVAPVLDATRSLISEWRDEHADELLAELESKSSSDDLHKLEKRACMLADKAYVNGTGLTPIACTDPHFALLNTDGGGDGKWNALDSAPLLSDVLACRRDPEGCVDALVKAHTRDEGFRRLQGKNLFINRRAQTHFDELCSGSDPTQARKRDLLQATHALPDKATDNSKVWVTVAHGGASARFQYPLGSLKGMIKNNWGDGFISSLNIPSVEQRRQAEKTFGRGYRDIGEAVDVVKLEYGGNTYFAVPEDELARRATPVSFEVDVYSLKPEVREQVCEPSGGYARSSRLQLASSYKPTSEDLVFSHALSVGAGIDSDAEAVLINAAREPSRQGDAKAGDVLVAPAFGKSAYNSTDGSEFITMCDVDVKRLGADKPVQKRRGLEELGAGCEKAAGALPQERAGKGGGPR